MGPALTKEEIEDLLSKLDASTQELLNSDDFQAGCKKSFEEADTNKSGAIDGEELALAVRLSVPQNFTDKKNLTGNDVSKIILCFDANKDGKIESSEFTRFSKWVVAMYVKE